MSSYRPPIGGLFRVRAPQPDAAQRPEARAEARDAIRNFVRVLERMDREAHRPERPRAPKDKP